MSEKPPTDNNKEEQPKVRDISEHPDFRGEAKQDAETEGSPAEKPVENDETAYDPDAERQRYVAKKEALYRELNRIAREVREMPTAGEQREEGYDPEAKKKASQELDRLGVEGGEEMGDEIQEFQIGEDNNDEGEGGGSPQATETPGVRREEIKPLHAGTEWKPLNKFEAAIEKVLEIVEKAYVKTKNFLQPLLLRYNPDRENAREKEYEEEMEKTAQERNERRANDEKIIFKEGEMEYLTEVEVKSAEDLRINKKKDEYEDVVMTDEHGKDHIVKKKVEHKHKKYKPDYGEYKWMRKQYERDGYFPVGVYDEYGNFTGKMKIYRRITKKEEDRQREIA